MHAVVGTPVGAANAATGTTIASPSLSTTSGNFLCVFVFCVDSSTVTGVTDTAGNTYTRAGTDQSASGNKLSIWFTAAAITGNAANVATATLSPSATGRAICQAEFAADGTSVAEFDAQAALVWDNTSPNTTGSLTTTVADGLIVASFSSWDTLNATLTSGTATVLWTDASPTSFGVAYLQPGATGNYAPNVTQSEGNWFVNTAVALKFSGGGGISVSVTGQQATSATGAVGITGVIPRVDYIGIITPVESNNANLTLTEPVGTQQGDLLIAAIAHRSAIGFDKPADWTSKLLDQSSGNTSTAVSTSIASGELFYTVRGASAPTLTFTKQAGTGDVNRGVIVALRGQDTTTPIRASLETTLAANSNTVVTTGTISPQIGDCVLAVFCGADNITWSAEQINGAPTALTEIVDAGSNTGADNSIGVAYLTLTQSAITTQTVQATASGTNSRHVVLVVDVAPQATSVPVTVTLGAGSLATATVGAPSVAVHQAFTAGNLGATVSGGNGTIIAVANTTPTGQSSAVTVGSVSVTGAASTTITGRSATATVTVPTVSIGLDVVASPVGQSATATQGLPVVTAASNAAVIGIGAMASRGSPGVSTGDITWASYPGATSYRLYWGTTSASYTQNVNVGNVLSYPLSSLGLAANTTYYIQVRAFDGVEHDHEAEKVALNNVLATDPYLVLLVSGLGAVASRGVPTVTAAANQTSPSIATTSTVGAVTVSAVGNAVVNLVGLSAAASYGTVAAAVVLSVPVVGLAATATIGVPIPGAPVTVSVSGFALSVARGVPGAFGGSLTWNASTDAISYRIYWGTTSGIYTQSLDVGNVLSYPLASLGLQRETTYYSVVRAWGGAAESAASSEIILFNGGMLAEPYTLAVVPGRGATASRGVVTVAVNVIASPVGRSATATLGTPTVQTTGNVTVAPTTVERVATVGAPVVTGPAGVPLTSPALVSALGSVVVIAQVNESVLVSVTGLGAVAARGNVNVTAAASVTPVGMSATATRGVPVASVNVSVGAVAPIALSASRGVATVAGAANVTPTGVSAAGQTGNAVVVSNVITNLVGNVLTSELNALDIDVVATVDYQILGCEANISLGPSAVTIEGSISFGIDGVLASANFGALQHIGTAVVPIGGYLQTSSLNSPAVTATQVAQLVGRSSAVTVGTTTVLTAAGEVSVDVTGQALLVSVPTAVVSIDSVYALPPGFYSVSALGGILEFKYGMDVYVDGIQLTADVNPVSFSNDVNVLAGVLTAATYIGTVHVAQQGDATPIGLPSTCSLGNVKARTRNPHSYWVNVMVRRSRSIFRSGRMW